MAFMMLEACQIRPFINSATSRVELTLPLTYFDIRWLKFFPTQTLYFYQLPQHDSTPAFFNSVILPKLKHSLSLTLFHFLPVAGNIIWPVDSVKPFILYTPNDCVSLIVAESKSNLHCLNRNEMHEAEAIHLYIPELPVLDSKVALVAFQITFFPSQGFAIGMSTNHAMFDGKNIAMFMKAWAHICKENFNMTKTEATLMLPLKLTPSFDRTVFTYPHEIDMLHLNNVLRSSSDLNPKSLKLLGARKNFHNLVRANFEFSPQDIIRLRQKIILLVSEDVDAKHMHLSPFVVCLAYTLVCMIRARMINGKGKVGVVVGADGRSRLDPPLPSNYFGNCVFSGRILINVKDIMNNAEATDEGLGVQLKHPKTPMCSDGHGLDRIFVNPLGPSLDGVAFVAKEISEKINGLETRVKKISIEQEKENILEIRKIRENSDLFISVTWSHKFEIYKGTDFGWGKLTKMQVVSIDNNGMISMTESRDGNGGIEIGLVMKRHEMEMFNSFFINGLQNTTLSSML